MREQLQRYPWAALIGAFVVLWLMENSVEYCHGSVSQSTVSSESSVYVLAGEFRTVFANLLWIKTDDYLHEYIAHGGDAFKNKEALPMVKLITELDPHFVEAYRVGAMILYEGLDKDDEAVKFLHEGISRNPRSWQLYEEMGMYYARHKNNLQASLPYFEEAEQYCDDDFYRVRLKRLIRSIHRDLREEHHS